jgi:hypothetical protein
MDIAKLSENDRAAVRRYVEKKFRKFNGTFYPKKSRENKAIEYWLASAETSHGQEAVTSLYWFVFHTQFPIEKAKQLQRRREAVPAKMESSQWLRSKQRQLVQLEATLSDLTEWKEDQDYQLGEAFLARLRTRIEFIDDTLCDSTQFAAEFGAACKAESTASSSVTATSREAKFEGMIGFEQNASVSFAAYSPNWGEINAKLEQAFKAGAWVNTKAKAEMTTLGFSAEVQAAIAIGAQLNVSGELAWTKGKAGLTLGGEAEVFAGARAGVGAKLSLSATKGLEASLKAGAFAGFTAEVKGQCSFTYEGQDIAKVEATAGVTFGAGAEFEASIKAPIFGPTEIKFAANLTVGFGVTTSTTAEIDFSEAGLAASQQFRALVYCRTLAQGYRMDLINSDARNLHYLNKAIKRVESEIESVQETIDSFSRVPMEKRSLLM